jgi:hypothetical protein
MTQDKERFLERWSRLKREEAKKPPEKKDDAPPPALPALDKLTPESDFSGFMHPKVEDALRRVALKKLFSDPHFNVPDPFEAYSGDWTGGEPISEEMLAMLNQARTLLLPDEDKEEKKQPEQAKEEEHKPQDESASKDA